MKSNAAMKLAYLDQLNPRIATDPEHVLDSIKKAVDDGDVSHKEIAQATGYAASTVSQILNDKYGADTADFKQAATRFWLSWISKNTILELQSVKDINVGLDLIWKRRRMGLIIGDNGRGKTFGAFDYWRRHQDHTVYLILDATFRLHDLLARIAVSLNLYQRVEDVKGPNGWLKGEIIRHLQREQRLIIIDEADRLKPSFLEVLQTIRGDIEGRCAVAFIGTTNLEGILRDPKRNLRYVDTRISVRIRVQEMSDADILSIVKQFPHDLDRSEIRKLREWANDDSANRAGIRGVFDLMTLAYDFMLSADSSRIDEEHIRNAQAMM